MNDEKMPIEIVQKGNTIVLVGSRQQLIRLLEYANEGLRFEIGQQLPADLEPADDLYNQRTTIQYNYYLCQINKQQ